MIALACASHVLIDLPLFGAPVLLLSGGVWWTTRSERRRAPSRQVASLVEKPAVSARNPTSLPARGVFDPPPALGVFDPPPALGVFDPPPALGVFDQPPALGAFHQPPRARPRVGG